MSNKLHYASPVKRLSKIYLLCKQKSSRINDVYLQHAKCAPVWTTILKTRAIFVHQTLTEHAHLTQFPHYAIPLPILGLRSEFYCTLLSSRYRSWVSQNFDFKTYISSKLWRKNLWRGRGWLNLPPLFVTRRVKA